MPQEMEVISYKIKRDKITTDAQLKSIKAKGKFNFTFKCADAQTAEKVELEVKQQYKDSITISKVESAKNQVKITKNFTESIESDEVFDQIIAQNSWMQDLGLVPERMYSVSTTYHLTSP